MAERALSYLSGLTLRYVCADTVLLTLSMCGLAYLPCLATACPALLDMPLFAHVLAICMRMTYACT